MSDMNIDPGKLGGVGYLHSHEVTVTLRSPAGTIAAELETNLPAEYRAVYLPPVLAEGLVAALRAQAAEGWEPEFAARQILNLVTGDLLGELAEMLKKRGGAHDAAQDG